MRVALVVLAAIGVVAIVFVIPGVLIRIIGFLLWVGIIILVIAALAFLVRSIANRRA